MNQILYVRKNKSIYKFQLYISLFIITIIILVFAIYKYNINLKASYSKKILDNYSISKLYTNYTKTDVDKKDQVIGIIEIPKINISYPIFSSINDQLLRISPCKFFGTMPNSISNLCIAGHNYNNNLFFSNINKLNIDDEIYIYNNNSRKFDYLVTDNYELDENDLYKIYDIKDNEPTLTLVTCNNINKKRIIVNAKIEK